MILRTPRPDLPRSIHDHLKEIKWLFVQMNPDIPDGPLVTMLNAALEPKYRGSSYRVTARELLNDDFGQLQRLQNMRLIAQNYTIDVLALSKMKRCKLALALMVLIEDGMHPLATLTGYHMSDLQLEHLEQQNPKNTEDFRSIAGHVYDGRVEEDRVSAFFSPAIVTMNTPSYSVFYDQKKLAEQHLRFAPLLSNKRDLLSVVWEAAFQPKKDRFERNGAKVTALVKAIAAITETDPTLSSDRVKRSDWQTIQHHLWAVSGLVAELGEIQSPERFLHNTLAYPAQILPSTIMAVDRIKNHPLKEPMFDRLANHLRENDKSDFDGMLLAAAACPDFAKKLGKSYLDIMDGEFQAVLGGVDLPALDLALGPVARAWRRPMPSEDIGLLDTPISKQAGWIEKVEPVLKAAIVALRIQHGRFPQSLISGHIPLSFLDSSLSELYAAHILKTKLSKAGIAQIKTLIERGDLNSTFVMQELAIKGQSSNKDRIWAAYKEGIITTQDVSNHAPVYLDHLISADLGI